MQNWSAGKKSSRSAPLRGRGTPANLARLRSERARNSFDAQMRRMQDAIRTRPLLLLPVVVATQEFVAFDRSDDADGALVARFGPLHAA
jgi:hypothetical protein